MTCSPGEAKRVRVLLTTRERRLDNGFDQQVPLTRLNFARLRRLRIAEALLWVAGSPTISPATARLTPRAASASAAAPCSATADARCVVCRVTLSEQGADHACQHVARPPVASSGLPVVLMVVA